MSSIPSDLRYTEHDEWLRKLPSGEFEVGITDYAQDQLGDIVHVELPEEGRSLSAGEAVAEVESSKTVAEIYMPITGEITAINEDLDGAEEKLNDDPYGEGWLFRFKADDADGAYEALLDAQAYGARIG